MFRGQITHVPCSEMLARLAVCICLIKMLCVYCEATEEPFGCSTITVLAQLLEKQIKMETRMEEMLEKEKKMQAKIADIEKHLEDVKRSQAAYSAATPGRGSVYVRWGKNQCPDSSSLVYNGYIGGKLHADKGSGSDSLCLPADPSWLNYTDGINEWTGRIYGTEIDLEDSLLSIFGKQVYQQDMPCAVCKTSMSTSVMIPARSSCYHGWKQEYKGYLMSAYHGHFGPHNYICVDSLPDFIPHGGKDNNEHVLYLVEAVCGSLPCPPYVNGRELACVVCSC